MKLLLLFLSISSFGWSQVIDFENLDQLKAGDAVGEIHLLEADYSIQFYIGHDINDTIPLQITPVAYETSGYGFYGPESDLDCKGNKIPAMRLNQINDSKFVLNKKITNRERVGCYFVSGLLKSEVLPSIFIFYNKPVKGCSADILDLDGHENTIEAYDIYCYETPADYPLNPVNIDPVEIRSIGRTFGPGILGDNGGVMPFSIDFIQEFTLIEIRPIQQVSGGNDLRTEFGFALDNYSPLMVEQPPYIPPYLSGEDNQVRVERIGDARKKQQVIDPPKEVERTTSNQPFIVRTESIYFDFDEHQPDAKAIAILDDILDDVFGLQALPNRQYEIIVDLSGYTDPVGDVQYNEQLSKNRTRAAQAYLVRKGIDSSLIRTNYHGEDYDGEQSDEDWKKRTVLIRLHYREVR